MQSVQPQSDLQGLCLQQIQTMETNRQSVIRDVKKYFRIDELVCPHVFRRDGELAWRYFSTEFLETLLAIRRILGQPMIINNYKSDLTQRGLRCNLCEIVKSKTSLYMSAHVLGEAFDATVKGMTAAQARELIKIHSYRLPYPIRMERNVEWLHVDVFDNGNGDKITEFNR